MLGKPSHRRIPGEEVSEEHSERLQEASRLGRTDPGRALFLLEEVIAEMERFVQEPGVSRSDRVRYLLLSSRALRNAARLHGELGRPDLALDCARRACVRAQEAIEAAKQDEAVFAVLSGLLQVGWCWYAVADEEHLRLGEPRRALAHYDKAVEFMSRAAVLAASPELVELGRLVEFPSRSLAVDILLTVARIESLCAILEQTRVGSTASALKRYDRAAATALRALAVAEGGGPAEQKVQAFEAASAFLVEAARLMEASGSDFGGAARRYLLASRFAARAGSSQTESGRTIEATRSLVAASHAAYRAALCMDRTGDSGVHREFERAARLAQDAADKLGKLGLQAARGQAMLAVGRIWLACGRHLERRSQVSEALECFRRAVQVVSAMDDPLPGGVAREMERLRLAALGAVARLEDARPVPGASLGLVARTE